MSVDFSQAVATIGDHVVTLAEASLAAGVIVLAIIFFMVLSAMKTAKERSKNLNQQFGDVMRFQAEMTGRLQSLSETNSTGYSDMSRNLNERLEQVSKAMVENLEANATRTTQNMGLLNERLDKVSHRMSQSSSLMA